MLEAKSNLELIDLRLSTTVLEELLRDGNDERLAEVPSALASEQMEELRGGGALSQGEVHALSNLALTNVVSGVLIISVGQLEETLNTARGVLGTSTIVTVREEHDQARFDVPLGLARSHKLVNHDLSTVCEITELGLPKDERHRVSLGVAMLEAENGILGQVRVRGDETACAVLLSHSVDGNIGTITVLVEDVGMSVRESTALDILTRKSNVVALIDQ